MADVIYIPADTDQFRDVYEQQGGGVCGISCLCVILHKTHEDLLKEWKDYPGYCNVKPLRAFLESKGYSVKQRNGKKGYNINLFPNSVALARIQWKGEDGGDFHGYKSFQEATMHTHFIVITERFFYCNAIGWLNRAKLYDYLKEGNGYITSYLEITRKQHAKL